MACKVFISWSGPVSGDIARFLKSWLKSVIQSLEAFCSSDDINKGVRWRSEIAVELETSNVGLLCITRENLVAPWLMFEAGALSKGVGQEHVCPVLFGVENSDVKEPIAQFQTSNFDKTDFKKLVDTLNRCCGDRALSDDVLNMAFERSWPELERHVSQCLDKLESTESGPTRTDRDVLNELLEITRRICQSPMLNSSDLERAVANGYERGIRRNEQIKKSIERRGFRPKPAPDMSRLQEDMDKLIEEMRQKVAANVGEVKP